MEQRDYILREIEKIGLLLRGIFNKLTGKGEDYALATEDHFEEAKELILRETGFEIDLFLSLENSEIEHYISEFEGIRESNVELLADVLKAVGMKIDPAKRKEYLERALYLYELCNSIDKTFSFDRESKISEIKRIL